MVLDDAIKHCLEEAEQSERAEEVYGILTKNPNSLYEKIDVSGFYMDCVRYAAEQRQLAEWLMNYKELREENKVLLHECDRLIKEKGELLSMISEGDALRVCQLEEQLEKANCTDRAELPFQKAILTQNLPYTIGGGIGQSRICMFYLRKAHIGEVQASIWPDDIHNEALENGIVLL